MIKDNFWTDKNDTQLDFVREHGNVARPKYSNNQSDQMTIKYTDRRGTNFIVNYLPNNSGNEYMSNPH
jgi:hypothetical protein